MLFGRKPAVTGKLSHPRVRSVLPSIGVARPLVNPQFFHHPTIAFRAAAQIPHIAGGLYGDEFRPD